ncbi:MAG: penicillin-binding protein 2 [Actinobacteria bacterium]|nr:penicillin-binding protein 2 [Actinomycetota bacterium]
MNRQIRRLGVVMLLLFGAVFVKLNQVQVFEADKFNNDPLNGRRAQKEYDRDRGAIKSVDGTVLAQSVDAPEGSDFKRVRIYPERELFGQITGYLSFRYGSSGMEKSYDDQLTGQTFQQQVANLKDLLVKRPQVGNVTISVQREFQQVARDALARNPTGQQEGSVVALDPRTGELLAFWSYPSFDPNLISGESGKQEEINSALLNLAPGKPLLAHQYQERYPPGSTFKVVTASTGLQTGKVTNQQPVYPTASSYKPPQTTQAIQNFGGEVCGGALPQVLMVSCNSAFAEMGQATIGGADMIKGAESFGFNQDVPIDLPAPAQSAFPTDVLTDPPKLAQASIGQNDVAATPLQIAMNTAAVANGGRIMKPHVMTEVRNSEGAVTTTYPPEVWMTPLSPEVAGQMQQDMYGVVQNPGGTGAAAQIPGFTVGGKTGTAQLGDATKVNTWFTAFAGPIGSAPTVAVAVVVLNVNNGGNEATGGAVAAPIAKAVMQTILASQQRQR